MRSGAAQAGELGRDPAVTVEAFLTRQRREALRLGPVAVVTLVTWVLVPYLRWRHSSYTFTNKRLITREGIITRVGRDIPLFRINDFTYERDLLDRLLGCGTIVVSDATEKAGVMLYDVPRIAEVQRELSNLIFQADDGSDDGERPPTEPRRRR